MNQEHENRYEAPCDIHAEKAVLGAILSEPDAMDRALVSKIRHEFFKDPKNSRIFKAMLELHNQNETIDFASVSIQLNSDLPKVGGNLYITELAESTPIPSNLEFYAKSVLDKYLLRELHRVSMELSRNSIDITADPKEITSKFIHSLEALQESGSRSNFFADSRSVVDNTMAEIYYKAELEGQVFGVMTGIDELDYFDGLWAGEMVILAARPSKGKTALGMHIALKAAKNLKEGCVGVISLEMGAQQLMQRLLANYSGVQLTKIQMPNARPKVGFKGLNGQEFRKLNDAADKIRELPLHISQVPGVNVDQAKVQARILHRKHNLKMLVVDYLQLMKPSSTESFESQNLRIGHVSYTLKHLAMELNIPILLLCQLNRNIEHRPNSKMVMSDLRDSGMIEQDADVILGIHDTGKTFFEDEENQKGEMREIELLMLKNRNRPLLPPIELQFDGRRQRFFPGKNTEKQGYIPPPPPRNDIPDPEPPPEYQPNPALDGNMPDNEFPF